MRQLMDRVERFQRRRQRRPADAAPRVSELARGRSPRSDDATGCDARGLAARASATTAPLVAAAGVAAARRGCRRRRRRAPRGATMRVPARRTGAARELVAMRRPGPRSARWLVVGPVRRRRRATLDAHVALPAAASSTQYLQSALEVEHAANELAERYEEINLLYTISEILGRAVTLEETAATILTELSDTVGARRGVDPRARPRDRHAAGGRRARRRSRATLPPIAIDDPASVAARVFRTLHPLIVEPHEMRVRRRRRRTAAARCSRCRSSGRTPEGGEPLGVVNLSDRALGAAVHRRRPEARRRHRDADRHRDPERAARARVAGAAAARAGDGSSRTTCR